MKFAQYLNDTQTPEWKKAYIDYRALKKRITAIRRAQQGQQFHSSDTPNGLGRDTPNAPPATPRASISPSTHSQIGHTTTSPALPSQPIPAPKRKRGLSIVTSGNPQARPESPTSRRSTVSKGEDVGHSTGIQGLPKPEMPRRGSIFGRGSFALGKSMSSRGGLSGLANAVQMSVMPLHDLMNHLSPPEISFFILLDAQLDKVETFYMTRENEMQQRGESLEQQLKELNEHRRIFLAAYVKVPWAAAFSSAFRSTRGQMKITRTVSISDERTGRNPITAIKGAFVALKTLKPLGVLRRQISEDSSDSGGESEKEATPPVSARDEDHKSSDDTLETGIRFANPEDPSPPRSPVHNPDPDPDSYLYAKRKLKKAVIEHYRGLELLHNYRVLNLTGFRKALKKFEKVTRIPAQDQYMSEKVEKSAFASDKSLQRMMREMEEMYAIAFVSGNKKKAMKRLRGGSRMKSHHFSTWRSGMLMGLAIPALASGFVNAFKEDTVEQIVGWEALMIVYGVLLVPTLFGILVGLNLLVWAKSRINYVFIFELNAAKCMDYREYFEIPTILLSTLAYAFWMSFTQVGAPNVSPTLWPMVWLALTGVILLNPFPILFSSSRSWLAKVVGRLFLSGTRRVEFTDFWLGDQFCSLVFTLSNLFFVGCVYSDKFSPDWRKCGLTSKYWPVAFVLGSLPLLIRLVQSIKRYADSCLLAHLINGGKYGAGIVAYLFYILWRHNGTERSGAFFILYCLLNVMYSFYSLTWDLLMDWSMLRLHSPNILLRPELVYTSYIPVYYWAIISNVLLRFIWVIYIPSGGPDMFLRTFIVALFEMLRRCQWNFFRLENEHLGNMDQYRVTREVPLPYLFDDPHHDDDGDDDEDDAKSRK